MWNTEALLQVVQQHFNIDLLILDARCIFNTFDHFHIKGCNKLSYQGKELQNNQWYHVAVAATAKFTSLYLNGEMVSSVDHSTQEPHEPQTSMDMLIGHYARGGDNSYPLFGNVSSFAVVRIAPADVLESVIADYVKLLFANGRSMSTLPSWLTAFFPLNDLARAIDAQGVDGDSMLHALEMVHGDAALQGQYVGVGSAASVAGVSIELINGLPYRGKGSAFGISELQKKESDSLARTRRVSVKAGMEHAWSGYKKYAWGKDEVKPLSNRGSDNWGGLGVTLVDSLDTLWLMDMHTEFKEAVEWVRESLSFDHTGDVSVFETTIRELGGLLSAYDLSGKCVGYMHRTQSIMYRFSAFFSSCDQARKCCLKRRYSLEIDCCQLLTPKQASLRVR